ncbi:MAG: hypothetical protein CMC75_09605 [Flavobacteriaceae bacterium]|nr:hypothetical protein [Flavobacteriaceae bacterium]MAY53501.1 hypothetical protein [Flavobacteriaceae bacterium]
MGFSDSAPVSFDLGSKNRKCVLWKAQVVTPNITRVTPLFSRGYSPPNDLLILHNVKVAGAVKMQW